MAAPPPPPPQPQPQQQPQQYETQYQPQPQTATTTQPYDPSSTSQIQSNDPYSSYYASYNHQQYANANPDYSSSNAYYYPGYSTPYDPNSVYPPGVVANQEQLAQNYYYPSSAQTQGYFQPGQPAYGGGSQGGQSTRGRGGGRGRGRGGGRGRPSAPAPPKQPPQMAWCEVCRVDCNTLEILEKHKNGKKHQKNLKVIQELQTTTKPIAVVNPQVSATQPKPDEPIPTQFPLEYVEAGNHTMAQPSVGRGGLKRKMNSGRGGKWVRTHDGSSRFVAAPKGNQMVPILCELCNVKCESQIVYASHIAGKKHLSTLKRYQDHKQTFGEGVEALYPTPTIPTLPSIPVIPPTIPQTHQQIPIPIPIPNAQQDAPLYPLSHQQVAPVPQDAQALASMMLSQQNLPNPEAAQAALAELLNQHGIHDAQTLITQLVPYLLTQPQIPGAELILGSNSVPSPGPELNPGQGLNVSTEAEGKVGSEAGAGTSSKPDDGSLGDGNAGEVSNKADNVAVEAGKVDAE